MTQKFHKGEKKIEILNIWRIRYQYYSSFIDSLSLSLSLYNLNLSWSSLTLFLRPSKKPKSPKHQIKGCSCPAKWVPPKETPTCRSEKWCPTCERPTIRHVSPYYTLSHHPPPTHYSGDHIGKAGSRTVPLAIRVPSIGSLTHPHMTTSFPGPIPHQQKKKKRRQKRTCY